MVILVSHSSLQVIEVNIFTGVLITRTSDFISRFYRILKWKVLWGSSLIAACCSVVWNVLENSIENESGVAACYE